MEADRSERFREVLREVHGFLVDPEEWPREAELDLFDRVIDAWHEPTARAYNVLGPNPYPNYVKDQRTFAKELPSGRVYILVTLPGDYMLIDKEELWRNRARYNAGLDDDD